MASHSDQENLSLPVSIIIGAIIIGGSIIFTSTRAPAGIAQQAPNAPAQPQQVQQKPSPARVADIKTVRAVGPQVIGSPLAPITVAYWYDYQCGVCKRAEESVTSQIMAEYVNTGKIRIVFKDLQFLNADSNSFGLAARAVGEVAPSKFYEWHKAVYDNLGKESSNWTNNKEKIMYITVSVLGKANADRVASLMVSKAAIYQQALDADKKEGSDFGIQATPSFIIGKQLMVGLSSYENIKSVIDTALK